MRTAILILLSLGWPAHSLAAPPPEAAKEPEYTQLVPIVAVHARADAELLAAAKEIAEAMGGDKVGVLQVQGNPVCCVWIELNNWGEPNPGAAGYVIVNQPGGSIITASDKTQLKTAVARFKKSIRKKDGKTEVPGGLVTNYSVVKP